MTACLIEQIYLAVAGRVEVEGVGGWVGTAVLPQLLFFSNDCQQRPLWRLLLFKSGVC